MWNELLVAFALVLVIEGLLPALSPGLYRRMLQAALQMPERTFRTWGLSLMIIGAAILYFLRN
jgi:uncharacterized protein YjeT (DUF2065 family)